MYAPRRCIQYFVRGVMEMLGLCTGAIPARIELC